MDLSTRVQVLDEAVFISRSVNTLGKGMTGLFILGMVTGRREGKLNSNQPNPTLKLTLCHVQLVTEELGKYLLLYKCY